MTSIRHLGFDTTAYGDDFFFHTIQVDPSQPIQGYVTNPKMFCPKYRGHTDVTMIKPQIVLGFKDIEGEMELVAIAAVMPKQML